jgi:hypothetical protein
LPSRYLRQSGAFPAPTLSSPADIVFNPGFGT